MISSFKSKALEELFTKGSTRKLPQERLRKIKMILDMIHAASKLHDLNFPKFRLHKLHNPPLKGFMSLDVSGNYRIVFRWHDDGSASDVDYLDTH